MPSVIPQGFDLSALPAYNPQPGGSFVASSQNLTQGIGRGYDLVNNGINDALSQKGTGQQNDLRAVSIQQQKKKFQDEQERDEWFKSLNVENAKADNPDDVSAPAKMLRQLSMDSGLPVRNSEDFAQAMSIVMAKQKMKIDEQSKNAQALSAMALANQRNTNALSGGKYGTQAQTLNVLQKAGIPIESVADVDAFNQAKTDAQSLGLPFTKTLVDFVDAAKMDEAIQKAQQNKPNQFLTRQVGVDANNQPIWTSFNRTTGQSTPLSNLPVMTPTNQKSPVQQVQALLPPGSSIQDYITGTNADGSPIYDRKAMERDIQDWQALLSKAKAAGNPLNQMNEGIGLGTTPAASSVPASNAPTSSTLHYGKRPDGTYGLIPAANGK